MIVVSLAACIYTVHLASYTYNALRHELC